jgi:hypothetical protein
VCSLHAATAVRFFTEHPGDRISRLKFFELTVERTRASSSMNTLSAEDWHAVISAGVCSCEESILLVSREGKQFPVNEQLARRCSPYFDGLLENPMLEAGKFCTGEPRSNLPLMTLLSLVMHPHVVQHVSLRVFPFLISN